MQELAQLREFIRLKGFLGFGRLTKSHCVASLRGPRSNIKFRGVGQYLRSVRMHGRGSRAKGGSECRLSDDRWDNRGFT